MAFDPSIFLRGYNPEPIESPQNALLRGLEIQRASHSFDRALEFGEHGIARRNLRAPDTPEQEEVYRKAREWQHATIKEYGTWANYWRATKHMRREDGGSGRAEKPIPDLPVANRDYFEKLPRWNAGSLSDVTKRMTGDRE